MDKRAAAIAGFVGGAAYIATMEIDNRLAGVKADDLILLGRPMVKNSDRAKLAGIPIHFTNSIIFAGVYAALAHDRLPGPPWLRGVIFANVENTVLYPLSALENRHPAIKSGQIDRYWTLGAYLLSIPRHIAYGIAIGSLYERLRRKG